MSNENSYLNIGTIRRRKLVDKDGNPIVSKKTGEPIVDDDGNPIEVIELHLKQDVDLQVGGRKVQFPEYELNGNTLQRKIISLSHVDDEIAQLQRNVDSGSVDQDKATQIQDSYARQNVAYTAKITPGNQA